MNHWELLSTHRHIKTGGYYILISDNVLDVTNDEAVRMVVYENEAGQQFTQPYDRFFDGRFQTLIKGYEDT